MKSFLIGLILGAAIAFGLGYNYGRGVPMISNPFLERSLSADVKESAESLVEGVKEKIHEVTKPEKP